MLIVTGGDLGALRNTPKDLYYARHKDIALLPNS